MDNRNGVEILDESDINKSPNISKNEKKDNDLIENDDIKIEDKSKVKNEKEELKNENNNIIINPINNNNTSFPTKFQIPSKLKKTFIVSLILAGLGIILIILGFINAIADATPGGGIMFWVLGAIVIIPGGYYSYQFYKAKKTTDEYKRQDILDNIPEL
jgi:hypothetical protein